MLVPVLGFMGLSTSIITMWMLDHTCNKQKLLVNTPPGEFLTQIFSTVAKAGSKLCKDLPSDILESLEF